MSLLSRYGIFRRARTIRIVWLPVLRQLEGQYNCVLSDTVRENILLFISEELDKCRSVQWIRAEVENHIKIGLDQPQCWIKYLIG